MQDTESPAQSKHIKRRHMCQATTLQVPLWDWPPPNHPADLPESTVTADSGNIATNEDAFNAYRRYTFKITVVYQLINMLHYITWHDMTYHIIVFILYRFYHQFLFRLWPVWHQNTVDQPLAIPLLPPLHPRRCQTQLPVAVQVPGGGQSRHCAAGGDGPLAESARANRIDHGQKIHHTICCHWRGWPWWNWNQQQRPQRNNGSNHHRVLLILAEARWNAPSGLAHYTDHDHCFQSNGAFHQLWWHMCGNPPRQPTWALRKKENTQTKSRTLVILCTCCMLYRSKLDNYALAIQLKLSGSWHSRSLTIQ